MSSFISSAFSAASVDSTGSSSNSERPQPAASTNAPADMVKLSGAQLVYELYNQGESVSQIASTLSMSEAAVNGYLAMSNAA